MIALLFTLLNENSFNRQQISVTALHNFQLKSDCYYLVVAVQVLPPLHGATPVLAMQFWAEGWGKTVRDLLLPEVSPVLSLIIGILSR